MLFNIESSAIFLKSLLPDEVMSKAHGIEALDRAALELDGSYPLTAGLPHFSAVLTWLTIKTAHNYDSLF